MKTNVTLQQKQKELAISFIMTTTILSKRTLNLPLRKNLLKN